MHRPVNTVNHRTTRESPIIADKALLERLDDFVQARNGSGNTFPPPYLSDRTIFSPHPASARPQMQFASIRVRTSIILRLLILEGITEQFPGWSVHRGRRPPRDDLREIRGNRAGRFLRRIIYRVDPWKSEIIHRTRRDQLRITSSGQILGSWILNLVQLALLCGSRTFSRRTCVTGYAIRGELINSRRNYAVDCF